MSRRGLLGTLVAAHNRQTKSQVRAALEAERDRLRNERERIRGAAREARESVRVTKEAKKAYEEGRIAETASLNAELTARNHLLAALLPDGLHAFPPLFDTLRKELPTLEIPKSLTVASPAPLRSQFAVPELTFWQGLLPGRKTQHQLLLQQADSAFQQALRNQQKAESARKQKIEEVKKDHQAQVNALQKEIDNCEGEYYKGDARAIAEYCGMVIDRSNYPDDFPEQHRIAFVPESKQLVVEYQLPHPELVPSVSEYRYVKAKDQIEEKKVHAADVKELYGDVVAAVALRTVHLVVTADVGGFVDVVVFNGFVKAVDPATGKDIRPHLVSVRVTKQQFMEIDLRKVQLRSCLRNLGAQLTQSPTELVPVRPIIEFDMADKRFVAQADLLSDLESRPNIMELSPFEFETLVSNLFGKMGLESKLTRSSRDGGVDAVAFDKRPVLGGKVVVQAKRYRHTVGVSAVRDLFGTMMNEGANKGILVTTSGYGPDAYEFAKDKPIELIDGGGLLYLLEQVGTKARIDIPAEE
jgi:restriction system protein